MNAPVKLALTLAYNTVVAAAVWWLSVHNYAQIAVVVVLLTELWPAQNQPSWKLLGPKSPQIVVGLAVILIIAISPKFITQVAVAALYLLWRIADNYWTYLGKAGIIKLFVLQLLILEACFLMAAVWQAPPLLVLLSLWAAGSVTVWQVLLLRGEPSAGILAATWGIILTELSWVFLTWLVSYVLPGNYLIVPQPVLVLGAVAYCCGSIYLAQRRGQLNRARLTEYLLMGSVIIWIIIAGTAWRGTI